MSTNCNPICPQCGNEFEHKSISNHCLSINLKCHCCELAVAAEEVSNLRASPVSLAVFVNLVKQSKKEEIFAIRRGLATSNLVGKHIARNDKDIQEYFL